MSTAQLRLPFVFPFFPQTSFVPTRLRSRRSRAANSGAAVIDTDPKPEAHADPVIAGAIAHIQARQALAPAPSSGLLDELARLMTGATNCPNESPMQLAASLLRHVQGRPHKVVQRDSKKPVQTGFSI